jgi:hypothetical protein
VQNKVFWYLRDELEKAVGLEGVDAISRWAKAGAWSWLLPAGHVEGVRGIGTRQGEGVCRGH